ncbi:MAG: ATP-binding protein [Ginsengibacter sp.]
MTAEAFISFFILIYIYKILRANDPESIWKRVIQIVMFAIVCLFVVDIIFHIGLVTRWIWHALLIGIITTIFLQKKFYVTRTLLFAVLPYAVISLLSDILDALNHEKYKLIENYFDTAITFSIVWMIAMYFLSRKQQKALLKEKEKTQQEEAQRKWIAAKNDELEKIVDERTTELRREKEEAEKTLNELKSTQAQLVQSEKMASLGELTAGIAHEIQNPLNFVNNFSEVNTDLIDEMKEAIDKGNMDEVKEIANDIRDNQQKINHHGKRADAIVKGMLQHSRTNSGQKEPTDINALADEYLRLSYHGLRAKDKSFNATMKTDFDESLSAGKGGIGKINVVAQDIGRVLLNLFNNAFYAIKPPNLLKGENYEPTVWVSTKSIHSPSGVSSVLIIVRDNGSGIPKEIINKIFNPFFTTKPTGEGTGLGLSMSYDIIKVHGGTLEVTTEEGEFTEFKISLPV